MSKELRAVPEGIVVTETKIGFFKTKVNETYYKPIPKTYYSRTNGGANIVWVDKATGDEIEQNSTFYTQMCNLWALEGHNTKLGPKV